MLETLSLMGAGFVNALTPMNLLMMVAGMISDFFQSIRHLFAL